MGEVRTVNFISGAPPSMGIVNVESSEEDDLVGSRRAGGRGGEAGALRRTAQELVGLCQLETS